MAQTNYTPISLYYSATASNVPTAANLVPGELAINTADGKLYYEDSSGVVQVLATKSTGSIGGSNTQVQFNNSGSLGGSSSFTWDGTTVTATKFAGALNGTVGATTASTGAFTTLTSNGATTFTAGTASTSTTTGTTVITGGLGVSGRINAANFDGIVGANTAAAGSFTTLSATGVATFSAGTVSLPAITTTGDTNTGIYFPAADTIAFTEGGAESMRIDSSGKVLIGNSTAISTSPRLQVFRSDATVGGTSYQLAWFSNATGYGNGIGIYAQDNVCGISADFSGASGGASALAFYTNSTTTPLSPTERMRIDSSGNLLVGTTSGSAKLVVYGTGSASAPRGAAWIYTTNASDLTYGAMRVSKTDNDVTTSQVYIQFDANAGASGNGQINGNGANAAAFGSFSDLRLKENIIDLPSQLNNILALKPKEFDYIESEGGGHQVGFIAQEMQKVYPDVVGERPDGMLTITGWSKTEARLVKAIQEQQALIDSLTTRLTALENK